VNQGETKMTGNKTSVFGVYSTPQGVERAGDTLVTSGFSASDISVLLPDDLAACTRRAGLVLSVNCATSDQVERAKKILERTMAQDISSSEAASPEPARAAQAARHATAAGRVN
jgi:hypothetical protein